MKFTKFSNLMLLGLALTLIAAGCRKHPVGVTNLPGNKPLVGNNDQTLPPGGGVKAPDSTSINTFPPNQDGHPGWKDHPEEFQGRPVYFEFDKSAIKAGEQAKLDDVANYLRTNPSHAVRIEGNCDERGTEEYNRSLGERRALAGREYLIRLGIDPTRVDTITYGEDRPAVIGHDEAAWSKNRRDEFVVLMPP
jgi:peptidoglycan-associated lipoprotein